MLEAHQIPCVLPLLSLLMSLLLWLWLLSPPLLLLQDMVGHYLLALFGIPFLAKKHPVHVSNPSCRSGCHAHQSAWESLPMHPLGQRPSHLAYQDHQQQRLCLLPQLLRCVALEMHLLHTRQQVSMHMQHLKVHCCIELVAAAASSASAGMGWLPKSGKPTGGCP
jgi:hypothetical protein